jgi:glutathione S-transferase
MEPLVLYIGEKNVSSWSMRAWVALRAKDLPFEERTISLLADRDRTERRRRSLTGRVPVLHHGDLVIPDSLAIVEYAEETFRPPAHPALWPSEPARRAHARWLVATMHAGFAELRRSMSFNLCFLPERPEASSLALAEAGEMIDLWADALARHGGPFLVGSWSAADAFFAPAVVRLDAFAVPTPPPVADWMERVLAHPPVAQWMSVARGLPPVAEE